MNRVARTYEMTGTLQGVGFRPALHRLAHQVGLAGWVQNRSGSVRLHLQGTPSAIEGLLESLRGQLPPNAVLAGIRLIATAAFDPDLTTFTVRPSEGDGTATIQIPPDLAICPECLAELFDPANRRYGYPFTTCTRCGPRYTVVTGMPYDRERTTLRAFPLCAPCAAEYNDPADRRFHAESTACPACGPQVALHAFPGLTLPTDAQTHPLRTARRLLAEGAILAVRGIGGFQLMADAHNPAAIARLRERKQRPAKPLAVMARDETVIRLHCQTTPAALAALNGPAAPIVILDRRSDFAAATLLPPALSPDTHTLGVMRPTSPLHHLLFRPLAGDPVPAFAMLVATSGNRRGEPICLADGEALTRLAGIADYLLTHNRDIRFRCDDSVVALRHEAPQVWRRARGMAPAALRTVAPVHTCTLALGSDLKNAVALAHGQQIEIAPHVGDLDTPEAIAGLRQLLDLFPAFLDRRPAQVAVDLHPDLQATRAGERYAAKAGLPVVRVQHHAAHAAACLAEHGHDHGLCLVFDGTGYGPDGTIWGAELLSIQPDGCKRLASFRPAALPGGDRAVREPLRQLVARFHDAAVPVPAAVCARGAVAEDVLVAWRRQIDGCVNAPAARGAGRLFDAVAALLGCSPAVTTYEGQAAIRLETLALAADRPGPDLPFADTIREDGLFEIDWRPLFRHLAEEGIPADPAQVALAFHHVVARAACRMVEYGLERTPHRVIGLSGGVFMNRILAHQVAGQLAQAGLAVLTHRATPPNDGGIAFGQAVIAGTWRAPDTEMR